jgi:hypothetical protein
MFGHATRFSDEMKTRPKHASRLFKELFSRELVRLDANRPSAVGAGVSGGKVIA